MPTCADFLHQDQLVRRLHAICNEIACREFVTQALEEKLRQKKPRRAGEPERMGLVGAFAKSPAQRRETRRIQEVVDREFDVIDPEEKP